MDRINSQGTISINEKRLFTDGDQEAEDPVEATTLNAAWFNAVQEELCTFMESQGIPLKEGDHSALTRAISKAIDAKLAPLREEINKIWTEIGTADE